MALNTNDQKTIGAAIINDRYSCKAFLSDPIPDETLREILELTLRAPTGFNTQPYVVVVARKQEDRERLAEAMITNNARKVREAPVTVVFAADTQPSKNVPRLQKLAADNGAPAQFTDSMPHHIRLFSGEGVPADEVPAAGMPSNVSTEAWAFKQTTFAAANFMFAAQAHGLATGAMEGFDQIGVRKALNIPERFGIPVVIALGHENPAAKPAKRSVRLPPTEIFFEGKYGQSSAEIFADK